MEEHNFVPSKDKLVISSKKKWVWLGVLIALFNPVFAGLIIGAVYLSEPELRNAGKVIATIAILWGAILFYLTRQVLPADLLGL
jgi:hypothetical protein